MQWINVGTRSSVNTKIKIDENKEIIMNLIPKWHINKSRHKLKLTIILRAVNTPNLKIYENHYLYIYIKPKLLKLPQFSTSAQY